MKSVIMFCGKGGVGKTTCAAAAALHYASEGNKTLVISTDFTPSLRHIYEIGTSTDSADPVMVTHGLYIKEVGYAEAKHLWDSRFGTEVYEVFSAFVDISYDEFVDFITSILPGIRDEFMVDYIRELAESGRYDKIVWDTAPAGQTLGLLRIPSLINQHLKPAPRIYSMLRTSTKGRRSVLDVIKGWEELSRRDIDFLRRDVEFNLITITEALAVYQLDGIFQEFESYGLHVDRIIINQMLIGSAPESFRTRAEMHQRYASELSARYTQSQRVLPLLPYEVRGITSLREVEKALFSDESICRQHRA